MPFFLVAMEFILIFLQLTVDTIMCMYHYKVHLHVHAGVVLVNCDCEFEFYRGQRVITIFRFIE